MAAGFCGVGWRVGEQPRVRRRSACPLRMGLVATSAKGGVLQLLSEAGYLSVEQRQSVRKAYLYVRRRCEQCEGDREGDDGADDSTRVRSAVEVATIVAKMRSRVETILLALLARTRVASSEVDVEFGDRVASLVASADELRGLRVELDLTRNVGGQANDFRGLLLDVINDPEVFMYVLADKLHGLRTLHAAELSRGDRRRIAEEVYSVYAPIAGLIGANVLKTEMEDLAYKISEPASYVELEQQVQGLVRRGEKRMQERIAILVKHLEAEDIYCEVVGRVKHLYSIHTKMTRDSKPIDQIYDVMAMRVIIHSDGDLAIAECYRVFGIVHRLWTPVSNRFKDYIAAPKPNGYQSLHTTVLDENREVLEVQIRTKLMHEQGEYGMAAHWAYKEGVSSGANISARNALGLKLRGLVDDDKPSPEQDPESEKVYCFTPNGKIVSLSKGPLNAETGGAEMPTPIDFAYAVHTELGHGYGGALVNGEIVSSSYELHSGDEVEILKSQSKGPKKHWLKIAQTATARRKIRSMLNSTGNMLPGAPAPEKTEKKKSKPDKLDKPEAAGTTAKPKQKTAGAGLKLKSARRPEVLWGGSSVVAHRAKCCRPVQGEPIVGYVTRGRGLSIHRAGCPNVALLEEHRLVDNLSWSTEGCPEPLQLCISVRPGVSVMMSDLVAVASKIRDDLALLPKKSGRKVQGDLVELSALVRDHEEADALVASFREIPDVISVTTR